MPLKVTVPALAVKVELFIKSPPTSKFAGALKVLDLTVKLLFTVKVVSTLVLVPVPDKTKFPYAAL